MLSFDPAPEGAIPLTLVSPKSLEVHLQAAPAAVRNWLATAQFRASAHTHVLLADADGRLAQVIVGVRDDADLFALSHLPLTLPVGSYIVQTVNGTLDPYSIALSWQLGTYQFARYRRPRPTATLHVATSEAATEATQMFDAIALTRDLVNTPTEDMGPAHLADVARKLTVEFGGSFREWVGDELRQHNFPAIHAVGRASHRPPRLIEIIWGDPAHPKIAVVGKGVCFDTGGLNIKGADGMRNMKKDMGGGAHALALARLIMQARLPLRLQMLIPAVENAIGGNAYRPGDIVATRSGINIEVGNTDAEGRVVLADALCLAAESKPQLILDFATLTGAARVALGAELPATYANDDLWFERLQAAAHATQDPLWRMPLWQPYRDLIKSNIGDIVNTGGPMAGSITAALFLEHFIPQGQAWIHLDLFAWNPKGRPGRPDGGEAQTLRATFEMLKKTYPR